MKKMHILEPLVIPSFRKVSHHWTGNELLLAFAFEICAKKENYRRRANGNKKSSSDHDHFRVCFLAFVDQATSANRAVQVIAVNRKKQGNQWPALATSNLIHHFLLPFPPN